MAFDSGYALVIGVGTYQHEPRLNVPQTAEDARQMASVLLNPSYCGYPADHVTLLTDAEATRDRILAALDALATRPQKQPRDTILVFYSGHGEYGADGYYLTAYDTKMADGKVVQGTGVRDTELLERLHQLEADRALFIFNACHSGEISPKSLGDAAAAEPTGQNVPPELASALLNTGAGRVVITACRGGQKSYFGRQEQTTLFAQTVADGMRGEGVTNRRGYISVFDLYDHVYTHVSDTVRSRWGLEQEPELTVQQGVGVMAVALYRGQAAQGELGAADQPPALRGAVTTVAPEASKAAFEQLLSGRLNLAAGRDISNNTIVAGDQTSVQGDQQNIHVSGGQGSIINPTAPITQQYGTQHTYNTGGGDFVQGSKNEQRGIFGGTFQGPAIGSVEGGTINFGNTATSPQSSGLDAVIAALQQARQAAQAGGDSDQDYELQRILNDLETVQRAADAQQRQRRLTRAQQDLRRLADDYPQLQTIAQTLQAVQ